MNQRTSIAVTLGALAALAAAPAGATAAPVRTTIATVTVVNPTAAAIPGWAVRTSLRKGSRVRSVAKVRAKRAKRTLTLRPRAAVRAVPAGGAAKVIVRLRGRAPKGWKVTPAGGKARACSVKRSRKRTTLRLAVRCTLGPKAETTPTGTTPGAGVMAFAPYADLAAYPAPKLGAIRAAPGVDAITVGFVTAQGGTDCVPTWGGYAEYQAAGASPYELANVQQAGTDRIVSFGGAAGTELARVCPNAGALAAAYQSVLDAYGATRADFDVEGEATMADTAATARRNAAIASLVAKGTTVSYTLAVTPAGLADDALALLQDAQAKNARPAIVNVMAMDYGSGAAPDPAGRMGDYAIQAGEATVRQLATVLPGSGYGTLGVTPMIGINDVSSEVFGLADAAKLRAWASGKGVGRLAMWQIGRDKPCATPKPTTQETCSGVDQADYAFSKALNGK